jgi:hypothetical protein
MKVLLLVGQKNPQCCIVAGPFVNSEFYTTWFTWWSNPKEVVPDVAAIRRNMDWMWNAGASFSFYMIHGIKLNGNNNYFHNFPFKGGSNFNFLAGNKHDSYHG